ncbi:GNAT family N-acetyltransferase [Dyadobacter sp. CY323]|uniref:GNAT family N-acetyltransferase n=1 Tax=Dyadobacter sp. CY323 TaxID=2907302 RepID=UPI001F2F5FF5|nr:GNAT family N-acetyltransferase [Dyadobacter sp. CY323]MCE6992844.1 GNAT family N-acetyltransferase [Dyadobacter sp. CY323]
MITIIRTNSDNPDFQKLTSKLDIELCRIYNTQPEDYEEYNRITDLKTVILAYFNDELVGCGCFKQFNGTTIELKRMYVDPAFRGKGAASAMVRELEKWGIELGNSIAVLETGTGQPEAISMYHRLGYSDTENYLGETGHSICMKKVL